MKELTYSMLVELGTMAGGIALNSYQLRLLGIGWPPKHGWVSTLLGRQIDDELYGILMELRGPMTKQQRKRILAAHGLSPRELFQAELAFQG